MITFPEYPKSLGKNPCYQYLLADYLQRKTTFWDLDDLKARFDAAAVEEVVNEEIITKQHYGYVLTFLIRQSIPDLLINKLTKGKLLTFYELQATLKGSMKRNTGQLRHLLVYLFNFDQIQWVTLPGSMITLIAVDGSSVMHMLDDVFYWSDIQDPVYSFRATTEEDTSEMAELIEMGIFKEDLYRDLVS